MPRKSSRPSSRPKPPSRSHTTAAAPPATTSAPPPSKAPVPPPGSNTAENKGRGLLADMAATVSSVAIGSVIGHTISSMFFGGTPDQEQAPSAQPHSTQQSTGNEGEQSACEFSRKALMECLKSQSNCDDYVRLFKACQDQNAALKY